MTETRAPHGSGFALAFALILPFWLAVSCAIVEPVLTIEQRILNPIPEPLRVEAYTLTDDGRVVVNGQTVAFYKEKHPGELQADCAKLIGHPLSMGCTTWYDNTALPTIYFHRSASDYVIRHEIAHALQLAKGWGWGDARNHFGNPPSAYVSVEAAKDLLP